MNVATRKEASEPLLRVRNLNVRIGRVSAVTDLSFDIYPQEFLGVVGESGSGESVTAKAVLGLLPPSAQISGSATFQGQELINANPETLRKIRGDKIGLVFQDALAALDPVYTIGDQLVEALQAHRKISRKQARSHAADLLDEVGISHPDRRLDSYPHQLSGGQRQRIIIAAALISEPDLIIADEPTTALDVTVQKQVLALLTEISENRGTAVLLVTHDMGVVAQHCHRVATFYGGMLVEAADVYSLFEHPKHPYTQALLRSVPKLGDDGPFEAIPGAPMRITKPLDRCPFAARCEFVSHDCLEGVPPEFHDGDHRHRCIRVGKGEL
ncbi:MAG TPA: ABC transporter ATP-binding protein [Beutenbergiaceae bacterium]|nr:ABC transporter ATP-binding protein [Beutenbergiaceae bacterium]